MIMSMSTRPEVKRFCKEEDKTSGLFGSVTEWWSGPFYGRTPYSYDALQKRMFGNVPSRSHDSGIRSFINLYLYASNVVGSYMFARNDMWQHAARTAAGLAYHCAIMAYCLQLDWTFGVAYVVYPFAELLIFGTLDCLNTLTMLALSLLVKVLCAAAWLI